MAKVDRTFSMVVPPERAQALFVRDIAPELAKDGHFQIRHQEPGRLEFSDAVRPPEGRHEALLPGLGNRIARHIHVVFAPEAEGTQVTLSGHCEKEIRDALGRLGLPKHWPEMAEEPHD